MPDLFYFDRRFTGFGAVDRNPGGCYTGNSQSKRSTNMPNGQYQVLSPWAEADPIPFRGINPPVGDLAGKKIGLLRNSKRGAEPTLQVLENRLKGKYPTAGFSWFANLKPNERAVDHDRDEFEKWLKEVDAVVGAIGD
ncbi:MAG: hypothetical protein A2Z05_08530 [Chloroflexi bacterium RBG_16_60_22]|nr:MAG: hypothetical protein A2Z05_08530 [Chloroflexi bacterium RBG_16_60_22]